jgi:hypothetical protein
MKDNEKLREKIIEALNRFIRDVETHKGDFGSATIKMKPRYDKIYIESYEVPISNIHVSDTVILSVEFYK